MSHYALALFAHILGALGLFIGISLQWISVLRIRQAQTVAQVREWTSLTSVTESLVPIASLLILVAGIDMTVTTWGWNTPWIDVSLAALVFLGALGGALINRRIRAIKAAAAAPSATGPIPVELERRITDSVLWTSLQVNGFTALGVVFLMTSKPDLVGSLITIAVALMLGIGSARVWTGHRQTAVLHNEAKLSER